jgi:hypothetical protein
MMENYVVLLSLRRVLPSPLLPRSIPTLEMIMFWTLKPLSLSLSLSLYIYIYTQSV